MSYDKLGETEELDGVFCYISHNVTNDELASSSLPSRWQRVQGLHCQSYEVRLSGMCTNHAMHGTVFMGQRYVPETVRQEM